MSSLRTESLEPREHAGVRASRTPLYVDVGIGIIAALVVWKLVDSIALRDAEQLGFGDAKLVPSLWLVAVGAVATWLLLQFPGAGLGFALVILLGVLVANLQPSWLPDGDIGFVILRGSHQSAMLVLTGVGLVVAWLRIRDARRSTNA